MIVLHFSFCFVLVVVFHVASGAFFGLFNFGVLERLCINRIRPLLSMRGMLLGEELYVARRSVKPRPNSCVLASAGSVKVQFWPLSLYVTQSRRCVT